MKRSEIALIILVVAVSLFSSYFLLNAILGKPDESSVEVKTIDPLEPEVVKPNKNVFNGEAINPTVEIIIGGN